MPSEEDVTTLQPEAMLSPVQKLTWIKERSVESVRDALDRLVPDLSGGSITLQPWIETTDPRWSIGTAFVGTSSVAKFAWSKLGAERLWYEAQVLQSLDTQSSPGRFPKVVMTSRHPVLVVTQRVEGDPLTDELVGASNQSEVDEIGAELALFLSHLHQREVLASVMDAVGSLEGPQPQATTADLRSRIAPWIRVDQLQMVYRWCDWVDDVLRHSAEAVFVHGDLHGHNQVWNRDELRLRVVVDFESSGAAEAEYDFRYLPAQGPSIQLFLATTAHYQRRTQRTLHTDHVMAWHIRTVLGDALWRSEAAVPLPDGRTPSEWVDGLSGRLSDVQVGP